jgi:hypothetical protein
MTRLTDPTPLEDQIAQWRGFLRRRGTIGAADAEELDSHLRDEIARLTAADLSSEEAFLVAVKRIGSVNAIAREFAVEHSERLWKQLVLTPDDTHEQRGVEWREALFAIFMAVVAGVGIKLPALLGYGPPIDGGSEEFYARNIGLFAFVPLTVYLAWKRGLRGTIAIGLAAAFIAAAAIANTYPLQPDGDTTILLVLHLPIALWLAVGVAYVGGLWFAGGRRMDFVRFSGELAIYFVLIALGGGILTAFTVMLFEAIGLNPEWFIGGWLVPCGAMGAVVIASWLVEAKQSVIENMAPVLTRVFTPLFTILLLAFLATMAWTRSPIDISRNVLIGFDLLLVLVVGLVLYAVSARDPHASPDFFDRLQLVLVVCALIVDAVALAAIAARINEFGFTPNRVAALGENLILLVNLSWSAWLYARFIRGEDSFMALERWQTAYLPVYSVWAALVVIVFPPLFGFA